MSARQLDGVPFEGTLRVNEPRVKWLMGETRQTPDYPVLRFRVFWDRSAETRGLVVTIRLETLLRPAMHATEIMCAWSPSGVQGTLSSLSPSAYPPSLHMLARLAEHAGSKLYGYPIPPLEVPPAGDA